MFFPTPLESVFSRANPFSGTQVASLKLINNMTSRVPAPSLTKFGTLIPTVEIMGAI